MQTVSRGRAEGWIQESCQATSSDSDNLFSICPNRSMTSVENIFKRTASRCCCCAISFSLSLISRRPSWFISVCYYRRLTCSFCAAAMISLIAVFMSQFEARWCVSFSWSTNSSWAFLTFANSSSKTVILCTRVWLLSRDIEVSLAVWLASRSRLVAWLTHLCTDMAPSVMGPETGKALHDSKFGTVSRCALAEVSWLAV